MEFVGINVKCTPDIGEILIAELSEHGFDAFEELEGGLYASCKAEDWKEEVVGEILDRYSVDYEVQAVNKVNWNDEWEKNYHPIQINDHVLIRASFHTPQPVFDYELIVTPKMSFGTGHHATTFQVLDYQTDLDHQDKSVLDVGCGTGILSVMAHHRGASDVLAIDIDEWCIENSQENFSLNHCKNMELMLGGINAVPEDRSYDIVLANINKNVLLNQMASYYQRMAEDGLLILSGFYKEDAEELQRVAERLSLAYHAESAKDNWAMLVFRRISN